MEATRRSPSPGPRMSSPNAHMEIENHGLDLLNTLAPSLEGDDDNPHSSHNIPNVKTFVGGNLTGHYKGLSINSLNQSSLESTGPFNVSVLTDEFGSSIDSLTSDGTRSLPKFDSKTKSKFYNALLRKNPDSFTGFMGGSGPGSPSSPGSPKKRLDVIEMGRSASASSAQGRGRPSSQSATIIAWPEEDGDNDILSQSMDGNMYRSIDAAERLEDGGSRSMAADSSSSAAAPLVRVQEKQNRMVASTPILLPSLNSMSTSSTGKRSNKATSSIKLNLKRPQSKGRPQENNFMNSTFHDGNSNMSQTRHKHDTTNDPLYKSMTETNKATKKKASASEASMRGVQKAGPVYNDDSSNMGRQNRERRGSDASAASVMGSISSMSTVKSQGSWAEVTGRESKAYDVGPIDKDSKEIFSTKYSSKQAKTFAKISAKLDETATEANEDLDATRDSLLVEADAMVKNLPLKYLFSKLKLRHYALQRAYKAFSKLPKLAIRNSLKRALSIWREPPVFVMNEIQVGFMVISKRLLQLYKSVMRVKFNKWAFAYSNRFQEDRSELPTHAATVIQLWWRDIRVTSKDLFKYLWSAVKMCLQRRQAIKHMIEFEQLRRKSIMKMHRVVQRRRRLYFAGRSIIRPYLWFKLYRKVQMRLTRLANVRIIQRFYRMKQCRHRLELHLIENFLRYGGYSVVFPKIPARFLRGGLLQSLNMVTAVIQRAWFTSQGNYAAFIVAAARRAKEEHLQMLNDNALIIQHNWCGVLWNILNTTARQWNRARRISRAFRHYQYRVTVYPILIERKHRNARRIQVWFRKKYAAFFLVYRFKVRRALMMVFKRKKFEAAVHIQREFRAYKERERERHEAFVKLVAMQRQQSELVMKNIMKIQRVWRKNLKSGNRFPRHVYLIMWRHVRKARKTEFEYAIILQRMVKPYIKRKREEREEIRVESANVIWSLGKAYVLKLALWDRIMATRRTQRIASNLMKKNLRIYMFCRHIKLRCILRIYQKKYTVFRNEAASKMQRWFKRKWAEYYLPLREAGRLNYAKKKVIEGQRFIEQRRQKAARVITRFFVPWNGRWIDKVDAYGVRRAVWHGISWSFPRLVAARAVKEARYYEERIASKKMQKFCKKVIAWARFDKVAAYRKKVVVEEEKLVRYIYAANIIGWYWYRKGEKKSLAERFILRRQMLDEYARLDALKLEAFADRDEAYRLKKITDDNMTATINASWKQGSDVTGKNYYYNYVTGETSWNPPEHFKAPVVDTWLRQVDDKGNVYYYNMFTGESSWLPPCVECGEQAERFCGNCKLSYCERCHETLHGDDAVDEEFKEHVWALTEYSKEELNQGEVYCLECKKKACSVTCLECWDSYCKDCFKYTHASGHLKYHKTMNYFKAKKGWMCVKSKTFGEADYYMNGGTGITTYEKPIELMTVDEKMYYEQFLNHKNQAESFIQQMKDLQFELEDTKYERDVIFQRALEQGTAMTDVLKRRKERKKQFGQMFQAVDDNKDTIQEVSKRLQPSFWGGITQTISDYKTSLLAPQGRKRGDAKSNYIKTLLESQPGSPPK